MAIADMGVPSWIGRVAPLPALQEQSEAQVK
jgi:hypothetical protein